MNGLIFYHSIFESKPVRIGLLFVVRCVKFNLGDEKRCHIVEGKIANNGISKFFSPKGDGMLPGDIVWDFIKKTGRKLDFEEGYVIDKGAEGLQCKDCKYYMYSEKCLLIKGTFRPDMVVYL
jgi:hypothetical protein